MQEFKVLEKLKHEFYSEQRIVVIKYVSLDL